MCYVGPKIFLITLENYFFESLEILRIYLYLNMIITRSLKHKCVQYDIKINYVLQVNYHELSKNHLLTELDTIQLIE